MVAQGAILFLDSHGEQTMTSKVLKSTAQRAAQFCSGDDAQIHVVDGAVLRCVADRGATAYWCKLAR